MPVCEKRGKEGGWKEGEGEEEKTVYFPHEGVRKMGWKGGWYIPMDTHRLLESNIKPRSSHGEDTSCRQRAIKIYITSRQRHTNQGTHRDKDSRKSIMMLLK